MSDFILVILAIFIVFGVFRRYLFFLVMNAVSKKLFNDMNRMQQGRQQYKAPGYKEGKIHVTDTGKKGTGKISDDEGEYVDYEEVK
jgi:Domain of unknown function (DUF4834)